MRANQAVNPEIGVRLGFSAAENNLSEKYCLAASGFEGMSGAESRRYGTIKACWLGREEVVHLHLNLGDAEGDKGPVVKPHPIIPQNTQQRLLIL